MVNPNDGGCWFCECDDGEMLFDTEFDTFVHEKCLRKELAKGQLEAKIMSYLISELNEGEFK